MKVNIKKLHKDAVVPKYAKKGDAGMDLVATTRSYDEFGNVSYGTGLAFEIPEGYVGYVFPRSSNSKQDLILSNSVGVIDSGYRGEVSFKFKPSVVITGDGAEAYAHDTLNEDHEVGFACDFVHYDVGDRIGQIIIMPLPTIEFNLVEELGDTERGTGGFGSTGQ